MAKLLVQESNGAREFELVDLEINIGRELDNTLRLSDPSISRHHAVIRQGKAGYEIEDLQSSNGVLLNGTRVPSALLRDGDRITLGQLQLTFVDPPASPAAAPAGSPLGTMRMDPEAMARFRASTMDPAQAAVQAAMAVAAAPAAPAAPAVAVAEAPAVPAAPQPQAVPGVKPGPAFLHPWLPDIPDTAMPLRNPDGTVLRGDFFTRLAAALIDYSPMLVLGFLGSALTLGVHLALGSLFGLLNLALSVAYLILIPLYWMRCGASPGKKLMRLRVVPEADPAGRIDLNGAIMRLLGYLANGAIAWILRGILLRTLFPLGGLGLVAFGMAGGFAAWALWFGLLSLGTGVIPYLLMFRSDRRALEDIFSRSIVIKVDR
jgi:uncharacterized RDD family membrane protein YckC